MKHTKKHIVFKCLVLSLIVVLLFPVAFKTLHIFAHHEHEVCSGGDITHIHKIDLDCEYSKFQLNTYYTYSPICFELPQLKTSTLKIGSQYHFLSKYQRLHFSLRGPPSLA
ncbi:hypothetical protein VOI54_10265 [Tamlana sp. 2201CG12-4]|uniref:hypothetical protein n=1 Tax=Tamlana sp. 2201CG12-4 TaxID=3112582 RepID=UPI002DB6BD9A|nr:hypothetical protein [Tamlana sp. 2201CG12-4]MEC3907403.1 hypothetical protein [Tamlana sp. 2201CG12-4]